jgi:hypothetical protein
MRYYRSHFEVRDPIKEQIKLVCTCDADERRRYLGKCYTQKREENDQEEDPEQDG